MTLAILFQSETMELLQNEFITHFSATQLFSVRTESIASLQSRRNADSDAQCKQALRQLPPLFNAHCSIYVDYNKN